MKKYLFIMEMESGCDYTIGCGKNYEEYTAENIVEAYKKLAKDYGIDSDYCYSECELEDIRCYEISNYTSFEQLKNELKEYNEYLKLKEKFE